LQEGSLPLTPQGRHRPEVAHVCTSVLVWPEGEEPAAANTVLTDPCFPRASFPIAEGLLRQRGKSFADVGHVFATHQPGAPRLYLPVREPPAHFVPFRRQDTGPLAGIETMPCPGHSPDLKALVFRSAGARVWIVGDAILNGDWLRAWGYYWPNCYGRAELVEPWRSVARVPARADLVIPGHGAPIAVTADLLVELLAGFPHAEYAGDCPDVAAALRQRLACG